MPCYGSSLAPRATGCPAMGKPTAGYQRRTQFLRSYGSRTDQRDARSAAQPGVSPQSPTSIGHLHHRYSRSVTFSPTRRCPARSVRSARPQCGPPSRAGTAFPFLDYASVQLQAATRRHPKWRCMLTTRSAFLTNCIDRSFLCASTGKMIQRRIQPGGVATLAGLFLWVIGGTHPPKSYGMLWAGRMSHCRTSR